MITIYFDKIPIDSILQNQKQFDHDNEFNLAIEKHLSDQLFSFVESINDVFDIKIKVKIEDCISIFEIFKKGFLIIDYIEICFKHKMFLETTDFYLSDDITCGYKSYDGYHSVSNFDIKRIKQKKATKYVKTFGYVNLPSTYFERSALIDVCTCDARFINLYTKKYRREYTVWYCCVCGKQYICSCFAQSIKNMITKLGPYDKQNLQTDLSETQYKENICHICKNINSTRIYYQYASSIGKYYLPYIYREYYEKSIDYEIAENIIRDALGVPRIGEGWISQTKLYNLIKKMYPEYEIQKEASPEWLGRQRYDIYIPDKNIAIEYQGKQHYEAVDLFGGTEGLQRAKQRDEEKRQKSKENNIVIIEFIYTENIDEKTVKRKLSKYLD